jgi:hypothetical protein
MEIIFIYVVTPDKVAKWHCGRGVLSCVGRWSLVLCLLVFCLLLSRGFIRATKVVYRVYFVNYLLYYESLYVRPGLEYEQYS